MVLMMNRTQKTQQTIEQQLEKFSQQEIPEDQSLQQIFGPMENWTLELGSQTLLLHPLEKTWYYLDLLHKTWEPTGFSPGQAQFVAVGNRLGVKRFEERPTIPEESITMLRPRVSYLLDVQDPYYQQPVPITGDLSIGRGKDNDIVLNDELASRSHARLLWDGKTLSVEDLQTTNGTEVNEADISGPVELKAGDVILIGNTSMRVVAADTVNLDKEQKN